MHTAEHSEQHRRRRTGIRRTAVVLALIALAVYVAAFVVIGGQ